MSGNAAAAQLVEKLRSHVLDEYTRMYLTQFEEALALIPMRKVLDKINADSVFDACQLIGISRSTYYAWYSGRVRPNKHQAERLQQLTDIPAEKFQGRR